MSAGAKAGQPERLGLQVGDHCQVRNKPGELAGEKQIAPKRLSVGEGEHCHHKLRTVSSTHGAVKLQFELLLRAILQY